MNMQFTREGTQIMTKPVEKSAQYQVKYDLNP